MTILMALLGPVAGRLSARFSTTPVMVAGLLVAAAGSLALALLPTDGSVADVSVAALGTIVAAGHHATGGAAAAFPTGLSHAMTAVAVILVLCAAIVAVLGKKESAGRHAAR